MSFVLYIGTTVPIPGAPPGEGSIVLVPVEDTLEELPDRPFVYEVSIRDTDAGRFSAAVAPWEECTADSIMLRGYADLRILVEKALAAQAQPVLISFWINDPFVGIEMIRKIAPTHLTPENNIFNDIYQSRDYPCTRIEFDPDLTEPSSEYLTDALREDARRLRELEAQQK